MHNKSVTKSVRIRSRLNRFIVPLIAVAGMAGASRLSRGAAILSFTDNDTTPTAAIVPAGGTFSVDVVLTTTAPTQVDGVGYVLMASSSGVIKFNSRTIPAASPFDFAASASPGPVVLAPTNGVNLGAIESSGGATAATGGTFSVSTLSLQILAGTPNGIYTLSFTPTSNYAGPGPNFTNTPYDATTTFTIAVPEPASIASLATAGLGLIACRRNRRNAIA